MIGDIECVGLVLLSGSRLHDRPESSSSSTTLADNFSDVLRRYMHTKSHAIVPGRGDLNVDCAGFVDDRGQSPMENLSNFHGCRLGHMEEP